VTIMRTAVRGAVAAEDIGHLKGGACH